MLAIHTLYSMTYNKYLLLAYSVASTFVGTEDIAMAKSYVIPVLKSYLLQKARDTEFRIL